MKNKKRFTYAEWLMRECFYFVIRYGIGKILDYVIGKIGLKIKRVISQVLRTMLPNSFLTETSIERDDTKSYYFRSVPNLDLSYSNLLVSVRMPVPPAYINDPGDFRFTLIAPNDYYPFRKLRVRGIGLTYRKIGSCSIVDW